VEKPSRKWVAKGPRNNQVIALKNNKKPKLNHIHVSQPLVIKGNLLNSSLKRGSFRLGELNLNFRLTLYACDSDMFCTLNFVLHMREIGVMGFGVCFMKFDPNVCI